jgi:signal transduction histidine kinase
VSVHFIALIITFSVGISVFFSNPRRLINQAFTLISLWGATWLLLLGIVTRPDRDFNPVPWIKTISVLGAFFPWILWWLGHCIIFPESKWRDFFTRGKYWLLTGGALAAIAASNWYIPAESSRDKPLWGPGAVVYLIGLLFCYLLLIGSAFFEMRRQRGIHQVEIKTLLLGGAVSCVAGLCITMLPALFRLPRANGLASLAVLFFYGLSAWGITSRKILDAQQLFLAVLRRGVVLVLASLFLLAALKYATDLLPAGLLMLVGLSATVSLIIRIERRAKWPTLWGRKQMAGDVRAEILAAGREEPDPEALTERYCQILRDWGRTDKVIIRSSDNRVQSGNPWSLNPDGPGLALLLEERWVTPESLVRRRVTPAIEELDAFMAAQKLGVLVLSPPTRGTTPISIGLGQREDKMPFLWPDVEHLLEWSELMEVALSRAQLVKRARETEQVATAGLLGATLAHEIRNPLVALKTFAQLLPERHNDPEFREEFSRLLQKEVGRIEGLTEQLLKLSSPRKPVLRPVRLNEIVIECTSLLRPKFGEAHTELVLDLEKNDRPIQADSGSVNQVVLNLLVNALQALTLNNQPGERKVTVRTAAQPREFILEVSDNGPGVPDRQRERLFQPFSSGKVNGFGLGLALSANIMRLHRGTIALVDTGHPGATFRISFPCPPS